MQFNLSIDVYLLLNPSDKVNLGPQSMVNINFSVYPKLPWTYKNKSECDQQSTKLSQSVFGYTVYTDVYPSGYTERQLGVPGDVVNKLC